MKARLIYITWFAGLGILLTCSCQKQVEEARVSASVEQENIKDGMEMSAFRIDMTPSEVHDTIYRIPNFQRADGSRPRFGNDTRIAASPWHIVDGQPRRIVAFFTNRKAKQIDISYYTATQESRERLFNQLHSNALAQFKDIQVYTDNSRMTLFYNGAEYTLWIQNPDSEYDPVEVSIRRFNKTE